MLPTLYTVFVHHHDSSEMFAPFFPVNGHVIVPTGNGVVNILPASLHNFNSPENVISINSKRF